MQSPLKEVVFAVYVVADDPLLTNLNIMICLFAMTSNCQQATK